jgi:hypothetical protein
MRILGRFLEMLAPAAAVCWLLAGCATTPKVNWDARVGNYTFDQAVLDYGPPERSAELSDHTRVCEWLLHRSLSRSGTIYPVVGPWINYHESPSPDEWIRLTFEPDGKLRAWKKVFK